MMRKFVFHRVVQRRRVTRSPKSALPARLALPVPSDSQIQRIAAPCRTLGVDLREDAQRRIARAFQDLDSFFTTSLYSAEKL